MAVQVGDVKEIRVCSMWVLEHDFKKSPGPLDVVFLDLGWSFIMFDHVC